MNVMLDNYSPQGTNPNTHSVTLGNLTIYFSYNTPVACQITGESAVVSVNIWSSTTGRHLQWIDGGDKESRIDNATFTRQLEEILSGRVLEA